MKRYIILLSAISIWLIIGLSSCRDDVLYDPLVGEGESTLSFDMRFESIVPTLDDTRTAGTSIKRIENVTVVVYNQAGKLFNVYRSKDSQLIDFYVDTDKNTSMSPGRPEGTNTTEQGTDVAKFKLNKIPYGIYYFYVVANYDVNDEDIQTPEDLKNILVYWNKNIAENNAMFGYFRSKDSENSLEFDAPQVTVSKTSLNLFAWVRRLASKVTVAFDPSGLNESVYVYIKSVTIHDIPKSCYLGKNNTPDKLDDLITNGETIYYGDGETTNDHTKWLELQKNSGIEGAVGHTDDQDALFFFENMQGNYKGQKDYYKRQIKGETGTSINDPVYNEDGETIKNDYKDRIKYGTYIEVEAYYNSQNAENLTSGPIKYRFMLGKDVEFDYDAERNHHYKLTLKFKGWANEPDWHIVYEEPEPTIFVPEKYYISYLYNQSMEMPVRILGLDETARQKFYLRSDIIENNWAPYDPDSDDGLPPGEIPAGAYEDINGFAWYRAAYDSHYVINNDPVNYLGFLSVRQNDETIVGNSIKFGKEANEQLKNYYEGNEATFGSMIKHVNPRDKACYFLNELDQLRNITAFPGTQTGQQDGSYSVSVKEDGSTVVSVPFYTRAKELVSQSDFTGNNVFYAYQRKAVVRFTLRELGETGQPTEEDKIVPFKVRDFDGTVTKEATHRDVPIFQVRRIVNPKAIWRAANSDEEFEVTLMHLEKAGSDTYTPFESEGKWRVSVLADPNDLIRINGKKLESGQYIEGSTKTQIHFIYKPSSKIDAGKNRGGIIKVEYHDYTCNHLIFVNQGYDARVRLAGHDWSNYNAIAAQGNNPDSDQPAVIDETNVVVTNSPLSIGSFFKRCQYNWAILEENNREYGWLKSVTGKNLKTATITTQSLTTSQQYVVRDNQWSNFWGYRWWAWAQDGIMGDTRSWAETWTAINKNNTVLTIPTLEVYRALRDDINCEYGYGIVYGDGSTTIQRNRDDAGGFFDYDNDGINDVPATDGTNNKGMRACIVYDKVTGNQIMFPLGAQGQGRRARTVNFGTGTGLSSPGDGALTYSGGYGFLSGGDNVYRPLDYNHYRSPGAAYWFMKPGIKDYSPDEHKDIVSWDINYYTLVFNPYSYNSVAKPDDYNISNSSDALPIKLIYKK